MIEKTAKGTRKRDGDLMTKPWACAAVVFRDTDKAFRFPLERPHPPMLDIKRAFRERGVNVEDNDAFLEFLIKGFVEFLRPLKPDELRPDTQTSSVLDTSMWLMVITKVANKRYWVVGVTGKLITYQPIFGRSLDEGVGLIESFIADTTRLLPGHITIH